MSSCVRLRRIRPLLICVLAHLVLHGSLAQSVETADSLALARQNINYAKTYLKVALTEQQNPLALAKSRRYLETARQLCQSLEVSDRQPLLDEIAELTAAIKDQESLAREQFSGVFPLVRLLANPSHGPDGPLLRYTLDSSAQRSALREAMRNVQDALFNKVGPKPRDNRLHLFAWSDDSQLNDLAQDEALYVFGAQPNVTLHLRQELAGLVQGGEPALQNLETLRFDPQARARFEPGNFLLVVLRSAPLPPGKDYWYEAEARLLQFSPEAEPIVQIGAGYCRDRSAQVMPLVLTNLALLVLAVLVYAAPLHPVASPVTGWQGMLPPIAGFFVGQLACLLVLPVLANYAPAAETWVWQAAWWPCLAGVAVVLGLGLAWRLAVTRLSMFGAILGATTRTGSLLAVVALGASGMLAIPVFEFLEQDAWPCVIAFALAAGLSAYFFGRVLEPVQPWPHAALVLAVLLAAALGVGVCMLSDRWIGSTALVAFVAAVGFVSLERRGVSRDKDARPIAGPRNDAGITTAIPTDVHELRTRALNPSYQKLESHAEIWKRLQPLSSGKTVWIELVSAAGCGKTSLARAVIDELGRSAVAAGESPPRVLHTTCTPDGPPYGPFRTLLDRLFGLGAHIDTAMKGVMTSILPFHGLLQPLISPLLSPTAGSMGSRQEMFLGVSESLRRRMRQSKLVLFIDNAQWLDADSLTLLQHLAGVFPAGGDAPLLILLAARTTSRLAESGLAGCTVRIEMPSPAEQVQMLTSELGLQQATAEQIVQSVHAGVRGDNELFWLFQAVLRLVELDAWQSTAAGWELRAEFRGSTNLLPAALRDTLASRLKQASQHLVILECAAAIGMEFSVSTLVECLRTDRLELLDTLRRLETESGVIVDERSKDDVFAFASGLMFDFVREELGVSDQGPAAADVPQVIREIHARIATTLETRLPQSSGHIYDVARHYYAAGTLYAGKSVEFCLQATRAARNSFSFVAARKFLNMANESAQAINRELDLPLERLRIDLDEGHVTGRDRLQIAQQGLAYLRANPHATAETISAVARACYEAGRDFNEQEMFCEAERLGRAMVEHGASVVEQAEGHQWIGLSSPDNDSSAPANSFRQALALLDGAGAQDPAALRLRVRVANSLGILLSRGAPTGHAEAKQLFEQSLALRERPEVDDRLGMARDLIGLANLAIAAQEFSEATRYLQQALEISESFHDAKGQAVTHRMWGDCELRQGKLSEAREHYRKCWELAEARTDKFQAGVGLLQTLSAPENREELDRVGRDLLTMFRESPLPDYCLVHLPAALELCTQYANDGWVADLRSMLSA
jgi:tetratricopeptide (TPR) repeat protein